MDRSTLKPRTAIVLYQSGNKAETGIEVFSIKNNRLFNPRPLAGKTAWAIAKELSKKSATQYLCGVIPSGLIAVNGMKMAFELQSSIRNIFIGEGANMRRMKMFVPNCVFTYRGPDHEIHAFWKLTNDPGLKMLVPMPMPNIAYNGHVCNGTMMQSKEFEPDITKTIERVENAFFGSSFNEWRDERTSAIMSFCESMAFVNMTSAQFWKTAKKRKGGCPELVSWVKEKKLKELVL